MKNSNQTIWKKLINLFVGGWIDAYHDMQDAINRLSNNSSMVKIMVALIFTLGISWFIYVPIHEMLHVGGCIATGGEVQKLVMGKEYGATFLKEIFPFIEPQTTRYAGRLTGFEPSNDFGYFITVLAPFFLTPIPGILAIRLYRMKEKTWLLGIGILIGLAPFWNLTGDYFEMGTIVSTLGIHLVAGGVVAHSIPSFWLLRSDDIFRLFEEIGAEPQAYGFNELFTGFLTVTVIIFGLILAITFAGWTYKLSAWLIDKLVMKKHLELSS